MAAVVATSTATGESTTPAMAAAAVVAAEEGATAADSNPVLVPDTRPVPIVALIFGVYFLFFFRGRTEL